MINKHTCQINFQMLTDREQIFSFWCSYLEALNIDYSINQNDDKFYLC